MFYIVTVTARGGLTEDQCDLIDVWVLGLHVKSVVSRELTPTSGLLHCHFWLEDRNARAQGLHRKIVRALGKDIDFTSHNALDVRPIRDGDEKKMGGYVAKDGMVMQNSSGWTIAELIAEYVKGLQKNTNSNPKNTFSLHQKNVEEMIIEYARRTGHPVTCKLEYVKLTAKMAAEGYSFAGVKFDVTYAQVLARLGFPEYFEDFMLMKLGAQM